MRRCCSRSCSCCCACSAWCARAAACCSASLRGSTGGAGRAEPCADAARLNTNCMSSSCESTSAKLGRVGGLVCQQCCMSCQKGEGQCFGGGGRWFFVATATAICIWFISEYGIRRACISQRITPNENTSAFVSYRSDRSTSGAVYWLVPMPPVMVRAVSCTRASPKSATFTTSCGPEGDWTAPMRRFPGLRSRWMMPIECRYVIPLQTPVPITMTASGLRSGFVWIRSKSEPPGTSSVTMQMLSSSTTAA
mmetsp:Transcript_22160/g.50103  ORF Transcript_22160/g.50103 Transcript_22160/m.50103 type:complete len:251 (-) Transcript_22160:950-1702(-)